METYWSYCKCCPLSSAEELLMTSASLPGSFPCFADLALSIPAGTWESLRAPCDDQRVLERSRQPIICLLVARCLASHFSRAPFRMFLPGELFHIWNGLLLFPLLWHTDSASDRFALCLLSVYTGDLFSFMYACLSLQKSLTSYKISLDELQGKHFVFSLPLAPFKRETMLLKMFPDQTQLMCRKCMWGVNVILAEQIRNVFHGHIPILVQA